MAQDILVLGILDDDFAFRRAWIRIYQMHGVLSAQNLLIRLIAAIRMQRAHLQFHLCPGFHRTKINILTLRMISGASDDVRRHRCSPNAFPAYRLSGLPADGEFASWRRADLRAGLFAQHNASPSRGGALSGTDRNSASLNVVIDIEPAPYSPQNNFELRWRRCCASRFFSCISKPESARTVEASDSHRNRKTRERNDDGDDQV